MWLFTPVGFFSIVRPSSRDKMPEGMLTIRARFKSDLESLIKRYCTKAEALTLRIVELENRDYPYRVFLSQERVSEIAKKLVANISYSNFKDEVAMQQGKSRSDLYHSVWNEMFDAERKLETWAQLEQRKTNKSTIGTPDGKVRIQCDVCGTFYKHGERHACAPRTK